MTDSPPNPPPRQSPRPPGRPWAVSANALLLGLQAGGLIGLAALYLGPVGMTWRTDSPLFSPEHLAQATGLTLAVLGTLALAGAVGLLRLLPGAWLLAVLVQGGTLALALAFYFGPPPKPWFVYLMMLYGLIMVLYLHQADVQAAFRPRAEPPAHAPTAPPAAPPEARR